MNDQKITWTQPYKLTCLVERMKSERIWREFLICAVVFTLNLVLIWLIICLKVRNNGGVQPMGLVPALVFSIEGGLVLACFFQLHWLAPSKVTLGEEKIIVGEWGRRRRRYDQVACVCFDTIRKRAGTLRLMRIILHEGREIVAGVPDGVDLSGVIDFLSSKGVEATDTSLAPEDAACVTSAVED